MNGEKSFFKSKTFHGLLVTAIGLLLGWLDVDLGNEMVTDLADKIIALVGVVWAAYGRWAAEDKLTA